MSQALRSCLYACDVVHARLSPRRHRFRYRLFYFAIDLDEAPSVCRQVQGFSAGAASFYRWRDEDFLPTGEPPCKPADDGALPPGQALKGRVLHLLRARGYAAPADSRILLVTLPRILGYLFNPVSFYFCADASGRPIAAVAEVTNTFREVKPYVVPFCAETGRYHVRVPKHFYVSPYSELDLAFDFTFAAPGEGLSVQIDDYAGQTRTLATTLRGRRVPLTSIRLLALTLRHPFLSLRVILLIHWQAWQLWRKGVPWQRKAAHPERQTGLYRAHRSLRVPDPS